MNKTKRRSFVAVLFALVCAFVLVFSLGMMSACGNETAGTESGEWYYGAAVPSDTLGQEGDCYLNTKTLSSYKKTSGGWTLMSAEDAPVWHYGTQSPDSAQGKENDFYLNTQTGELYQKGAEGWGEPILNLTGQKGRDGVMWFSGKGHPDTALDLAGKVKQQGDFYIDTDTWTVYQLGTEDKWVELGNIRGETPQRGTAWFYGTVAPEDAALEDVYEGDFYLRSFDDFSGSEGYQFYRREGENWRLLQDVSRPLTPEEEAGKTDYHILDLQSLIAFREKVNGGEAFQDKTVYLDGDIDLSAENWEPIGSTATPFKGIFDGQNHTITGLTVTGSYEQTGLFGMIGSFGAGSHDGEIKNVTFKDVHLTSTKGYVGTAVGNLRGTISGIHVTGEIGIKGENKYVAGVVGHAYADITDCSVNGSGTVEIVGNEVYTAGGIVGWLSGDAERCSVTGITVKAPIYAGGIVGQAAETACTFKDCTVKADVCITMETKYTTYTETIGGIIGVPDKGSWDSGSGAAHSDIPTESIVYTIEGCSFEGKLLKGNEFTSTAYYGLSGHDPVRYQAVVRISDSTLKSQTDDAGMNISWGKIYEYEDQYHNKSTFNTTGGTADLYTRKGLEFFRDTVNKGADFAGVTVKLYADVNFENAEWLPIGRIVGNYQKRNAKGELFNSYGNYTHDFKGIFDGQGHKISNVVIKTGSDAHRGVVNHAEDDNEHIDHNQGVGFFGYVGTNSTYITSNTKTEELAKVTEDWGRGAISNLKMDHVNATGRRAVGAVAGWVMGGNFTVSGITVTDSVIDSSHWVAGVVGYLNSANAKVTSCTVERTEVKCLPHNEWEYGEKGARYTGDKAGALVGQLCGEDSVITGCSATDVQISAYRDVGGLIGHLNMKTFTMNGNTAVNVLVTLDRTQRPLEDPAGDKAENADLIVGRLDGGADRDALNAANPATGTSGIQRKP